MDISVITIKEIRYFQYYIIKALDNEAVIIFAKTYEHQLFAVLLDKLGLLPDYLLPLKEQYYKSFKKQYDDLQKKAES